MFKILAGDFSPQMATLHSNNVLIGISGGKPEKLDLNGRIAEINVLSAEQKTSLLKTAAAGSLGIMFFGTAGLLVGVLASGKTTEMVVDILLMDGRKITAVVDSSTHQSLIVAQNSTVKN